MTVCPRCSVPPVHRTEVYMRDPWHSLSCPTCGLNKWATSTRREWVEAEWEKAVERLGAHLRTMEEIAAGK